MPIYLDAHASTLTDPSVVQAMLPFLTEHYGNASSSTHWFGAYARAAVEAARKEVAGLVHARPSEIFFTSGATESCNLAIRGMAERLSDRGRHIVTTRIEHAAVLACMRTLENFGFEVTYLDCDAIGLVDPQRLVDSFRSDTILVSVIAANNEIGTIQDIGAMGKICRDHGVAFHIDAAQCLGRIRLNVVEQCIDLVSLSAHKCHGPKGTGALFVRHDLDAKPTAQIEGGGQESGLRAGSLNVPAIIGFGKAAQIIDARFDEHYTVVRQLRDRLYTTLETQIEGIEINGPHPMRAEHLRLNANINCRLGIMPASSIIRGCPGIAMSAGSACSSTEGGGISPVLKSIGLSGDQMAASIRLGVSRFNTEAEIDQAAHDIIAAWKQLILTR